MHVTGSGYASSCLVAVEVTRPDGSVVKGDGTFAPEVDSVVTPSDGSLGHDCRLDGIEGRYRVRVLGAEDVVLATTTFTDQIPPPRATPSDPRAEFFPGNATTCAEIAGVPARTTRLGASGPTAAEDAFVVGTPVGAEALNVAITPAGAAAGVVIHAVVVKGANGFNVYSDPAVLPPALPPTAELHLAAHRRDGHRQRAGHQPLVRLLQLR